MPSQRGRGFAGMDDQKQREIASKGGKAAHQKGKAHEFTPEEAREAGSKGGKAAHEKGTAHEFTAEEARVAGRKGGEAISQDRQHMATIGRKGGESRGEESPASRRAHRRTISATSAEVDRTDTRYHGDSTPGEPAGDSSAGSENAQGEARPVRKGRS
jgi:uncharacterized protein